MRAKNCLAVVVLCAVPMFGQTGTGNELIKQCGYAVNEAIDGPHQWAAGYCMGLVMGVAQMQDSVFLVWPRISIPAGVTLGQEIRVVQKYLEDHPKDLQLNDCALIEWALYEAWPAPEEKKTSKGK
jgi:hypothetical protein